MSLSKVRETNRFRINYNKLKIRKRLIKCSWRYVWQLLSPFYSRDLFAKTLASITIWALHPLLSKRLSLVLRITSHHLPEVHLFFQRSKDQQMKATDILNALQYWYLYNSVYVISLQAITPWPLICFQQIDPIWNLDKFSWSMEYGLVWIYSVMRVHSAWCLIYAFKCLEVGS